MTQEDELPEEAPPQHSTSHQLGRVSHISSSDQRAGAAQASHSSMPLQRALSPNPQAVYDFPDSYRNLDDGSQDAPVQDTSEGPIRQYHSREERYTDLDDTEIEGQRHVPQGLDGRDAGSQQRRQPTSGIDYDVPDQYVNAAEVFSAGPVQNPRESSLYHHQSLEESRSQDHGDVQGPSTWSGRAGNGNTPSPLTSEEKDKPKEVHVSKLATQIYTISYLILFSIFGTLARLGLQALTYYSGAPVVFSSIWPNFAGSLVMGFLSEDRMLFRSEWGTPTYEEQIEKARRQKDEESGPASTRADIDLAAAKKAHLATKKTIPLYIGLATGFCGSFTSFSSFIRDVFLSLANDLPSPDVGATTAPRNGGYSFMALLAVIITTVSLSLAGLFVGAHLAIALERFTPTFPFVFTRKVIDRVSVVLAIGCWAGAVILSAVPPDRSSHGLGAAETWRGRATFALVFAPIGCLARFYASLYLNGKIASFPLGTFAVNICGTAILGMAWDIAHVPNGGVIGCQVLQGIEDGLCGCLTTVSTWVSELAALRRRNAYVYGLASIVGGLAVMVAIMGGLKWSQGFGDLMCLH